MESKIVKCPHCGVGLEVKNSRDEAVKSIKCPNCKKSLKVIFRQPQVPQPVDSGATILPGGVATADGTTQLGKIELKNVCDDKLKAHPGRLICNGVVYPLQMGQNIVGRKNRTKATTIMIDVNDSFMSRMHILINVEAVGDKLRATISNYQNTNETLINGKPLLKDEIVVLSNGTTITMGETKITYQCD